MGNCKSFQKQHVGKRFISTEMLWDDLRMLIRPERNIEQGMNRKGQRRNTFWS